jgi:hypothetical protein
MIGEKSNIKTLNFTGKTENPNTEIHSFVMAIKPKFFVKIDTKDNIINKNIKFFIINNISTIDIKKYLIISKNELAIFSGTPLSNNSPHNATKMTTQPTTVFMVNERNLDNGYVMQSSAEVTSFPSLIRSFKKTIQ